MLVLSRKVGEKIEIGHGITVEVRRISGHRVALAFAAPDDVRILRSELDPFAGDQKPDKMSEIDFGRRGREWAPRDLAVH